jgi:hypothetical protein
MSFVKSYGSAIGSRSTEYRERPFSGYHYRYLDVYILDLMRAVRAAEASAGMQQTIFSGYGIGIDVDGYWRMYKWPIQNYDQPTSIEEPSPLFDPVANTMGLVWDAGATYGEASLSPEGAGVHHHRVYNLSPHNGYPDDSSYLYSIEGLGKTIIGNYLHDVKDALEAVLSVYYKSLPSFITYYREIGRIEDFLFDINTDKLFHDPGGINNDRSIQKMFYDNDITDIIDGKYFIDGDEVLPPYLNLYNPTTDHIELLRMYPRSMVAAVDDGGNPYVMDARLDDESATTPAFQKLVPLDIDQPSKTEEDPEIETTLPTDLKAILHDGDIPVFVFGDKMVYDGSTLMFDDAAVDACIVAIDDEKYVFVLFQTGGPSGSGFVRYTKLDEFSLSGNLEIDSFAGPLDDDAEPIKTVHNIGIPSGIEVFGGGLSKLGLHSYDPVYVDSYSSKATLAISDRSADTGGIILAEVVWKFSGETGEHSGFALKFLGRIGLGFAPYGLCREMATNFYARDYKDYNALTHRMLVSDGQATVRAIDLESTLFSHMVPLAFNYDMFRPLSVFSFYNNKAFDAIPIGDHLRSDDGVLISIPGDEVYSVIYWALDQHERDGLTRSYLHTLLINSAGGNTTYNAGAVEIVPNGKLVHRVYEIPHASELTPENFSLEDVITPELVSTTDISIPTSKSFGGDYDDMELLVVVCGNSVIDDGELKFSLIAKYNNDYGMVEDVYFDDTEKKAFAQLGTGARGALILGSYWILTTYAGTLLKVPASDSIDDQKTNFQSAEYNVYTPPGGAYNIHIADASSGTLVTWMNHQNIVTFKVSNNTGDNSDTYPYKMDFSEGLCVHTVYPGAYFFVWAFAYNAIVGGKNPLEPSVASTSISRPEGVSGGIKTIHRGIHGERAYLDGILPLDALGIIEYDIAAELYSFRSVLDTAEWVGIKNSVHRRLLYKLPYWWAQGAHKIYFRKFNGVVMPVSDTAKYGNEEDGYIYESDPKHILSMYSAQLELEGDVNEELLFSMITGRPFCQIFDNSIAIGPSGNEEQLIIDPYAFNNVQEGSTEFRHTYCIVDVDMQLAHSDKDFKARVIPQSTILPNYELHKSGEDYAVQIDLSTGAGIRIA